MKKTHLSGYVISEKEKVVVRSRDAGPMVTGMAGRSGVGLTRGDRRTVVRLARKAGVNWQIEKLPLPNKPNDPVRRAAKGVPGGAYGRCAYVRSAVGFDRNSATAVSCIFCPYAW